MRVSTCLRPWGSLPLISTYPREACIRAEEDLVDDQACEINTFLAHSARNVVADADEDEANEEARQHGTGPESSTAGLHQTSDARRIGSVNT